MQLYPANVLTIYKHFPLFVFMFYCYVTAFIYAIDIQI